MATAMMNIHQFMKELLTFEDQKIKMVGTADEPWFCARDVCNVLGYNDYRQAISIHVDPEDKMSLYELRRSWAIVFATMAQDRLNETNSEDLILNNETKACYINKKGLADLIIKCKTSYNKGFVQMLINRFDLYVRLKIDRKEQKYIGMIKEAFRHEHMKTQYSVSNYRIDLFFPKYRIAVECDEHGHRDRDPYEEQKREEHIKSKLSCVFLRFNPDIPNFSIFKVINDLIRLMYSEDDMYLLEQQIDGLKI